MFQLKNVVRTTYIECTDKNLGGLTFRLDILQADEQHFSIELYQKNLYSLQVTGEYDDAIADEVIWVVASHLLPDDELCSTIQSAMDKALQALSDYFELE